MPGAYYALAQVLDRSDAALPQRMVNYVNQARPEGATLSITSPCFRDTEPSRRPAKPSSLHDAILASATFNYAGVA